MQRRRKLLAVPAVALMSLAISSPASAEYWLPNQSGIVSVCFQAQGLDDTATQAATMSADQWNRVTPYLNVTAGNCNEDTQHVVILKPGTLDGTTELGVTESTGAPVRTASSITYDVAKIEGAFAGQLGGALNAWLLLTCHEMGHALGLPHNPDPDSCMQTKIAKPVTQPGQVDRLLLQVLYGGANTDRTNGDIVAAGSPVPTPVPGATGNADTAQAGASLTQNAASDNVMQNDNVGTKSQAVRIGAAGASSDHSHAGQLAAIAIFTILIAGAAMFPVLRRKLS